MKVVSVFLFLILSWVVQALEAHENGPQLQQPRHYKPLGQIKRSIVNMTVASSSTGPEHDWFSRVEPYKASSTNSQIQTVVTSTSRNPVFWPFWGDSSSASSTSLSAAKETTIVDQPAETTGITKSGVDVQYTSSPSAPVASVKVQYSSPVSTPEFIQTSISSGNSYIQQLTRRSSTSASSTSTSSQPPSPAEILSQLESAYPGILTYITSPNTGFPYTESTLTAAASPSPDSVSSMKTSVTQTVVATKTQTVFPGTSSVVTSSPQVALIPTLSVDIGATSDASSDAPAAASYASESTASAAAFSPTTSKQETDAIQTVLTEQPDSSLIASPSLLVSVPLSMPTSLLGSALTSIPTSAKTSLLGSFSVSMPTSTPTVVVASGSMATPSSSIGEPLSEPAISVATGSFSSWPFYTVIPSSTPEVSGFASTGYSVVVPTPSSVPASLFISSSIPQSAASESDSSATPMPSLGAVTTSVFSVPSSVSSASSLVTSGGYLIPLPSASSSSSEESASSGQASAIVPVASSTGGTIVSSAAQTSTAPPRSSPVTSPSTGLQSSSVPEASASTSDWLPPVLLTQTPSPQPTESSRASPAGSFSSNPSSTPTSEIVPPTLPQVISPSGTSPSTPKDYTRIQIGFEYPLNYPFVVANPLSAAQIFNYLPIGLAHGLTIDQSKVQMVQLQPYTGVGVSNYIATVAIVDIPSDQIASLNTQLHTPTSNLYTFQANPSVESLMNLIDTAIPLIPGGASVSSGQSGGQVYAQPSNVPQAAQSGIIGGKDGSSGNGNGVTSSDNGSIDATGPQTADTKVEGKTAGITIGAVFGAAAYVGVIFLVSRRYRNRRKEAAAASAASLGTGGGVMLEAGRESPLTGSPFYDDVSPISSLSSHGRAHGIGSILPIGQPRISEPVMSQNSLGWA